jgi:ADP-ribosyl-[dinitrogen reductase] hydrolase
MVRHPASFTFFSHLGYTPMKRPSIRTTMSPDPSLLSRARGCLLGQLAGDSLGSLVEFESSETIRRKYPGGVREMADGGTWDTIAGQPTDDSEMALALARMLAGKGRYDQAEARKAYISWLDSEPFDRGATVAAALRGKMNTESQANGALMRISPIGVFGSGYDLADVAEWARQDAAITHPHRICLQANVLFAMAIAQAVRTQTNGEMLYRSVVEWGVGLQIEQKLLDTISKARRFPPPDYFTDKGWVLIAFQNALWQLLHAPSFEEGVVDTVMRGGDTDTNAAICGALLGAVYGLEAIPRRWVTSVVHCRPSEGASNVRHPRPRMYWPVDALELAEKLVAPTV